MTEEIERSEFMAKLSVLLMARYDREVGHPDIYEDLREE